MNISFLTILIGLPCLAGIIRVLTYLIGTIKMLAGHVLQRLEGENKLTFFAFILKQFALLTIFIMVLLNTELFIDFLHDRPIIATTLLICLWYWGVYKWKDLTVGTDNIEV